MSYGTDLYKSISTQTEVASANAHRLVQMLFEGAILKLTQAQGHMSRSEYPRSAEKISTVIAIIDSLRASLNHEAGGELSQNLHQLYDYMEQRLLEANLKKDSGKLAEVEKLLREIKTGWDAIAQVTQPAPTTAIP